ncbi:MAG: hypothetical protein JOZ97_03125, partial [Candidatus Eremiobacteraeota bacterium]|nr:hypothetical protein [Candidatus Eremiobacteraeota bacterium]
AEVRERLASAQRFKGYSALAAAISGIFAIVAGGVQALLTGTPANPHDGRVYFAIWFVCCAASMAVNYGAIAQWFVNDASARERWQTRTVGLSILPAVILGAALSFAVLRVQEFALLPGVWFGCYGVGLFASRLTVPRGVLPLAGAFIAIGAGLLFVPPALALQWWLPAAGFGSAQWIIAALVARERVQ